LEGTPKADALLLNKAASSLDYHGGYFAMAYDGLDGYSSSMTKQSVVKSLYEAWDDNTDPVAVRLKKQLQESEYFPVSFVEELVKVSYSYSYHAFAEKYGVPANRGFEDAANIKFIRDDYIDENDYEFDSYNVAIRYLEYDHCAFYEYDFDGDGEDEIGIPIHSGVGGATMGDGFYIYKKNADGLYELYSSGPHCAMRDAKRLIKFDDRYYFIVNPFSVTQDVLHDIEAQSMEKSGKTYPLYIDCTEYKIKPVLTKNEDAFAAGYDELITAVGEQAEDAMAATREHVMYMPEGAELVDVSGIVGDEQTIRLGVVYKKNTMQYVDIDNDGQKDVLYKYLAITQHKFRDEWNCYSVYKTEDDFYEHVAAEGADTKRDEFFGIHSWGNIYDTLPIAGNIVQLWTTEFNGKTYTAALTKSNLVYTLHLYLIEGGESHLVSRTLYFDEVQDMSVRFE